MKRKRYSNARDILPTELIREIQKYINGAYLYIPRTGRAAWGAGTGIREELDQRNAQIQTSYTKGIDISILAEGYSLSEERIRAIVSGHANSTQDETEEDNIMITQKGLSKAEVETIFNESVKKNSFPIKFVDAMYLKVHNEDADDTLTFYLNTTLNDAELRHALRVLAKEVAEHLNERICLRQTMKTSI